ILFDAATVLSLVLCVATAVLWVRSYSVYEYGQVLWPRGDIYFRSSSGEIMLEWWHVIPPEGISYRKGDGLKWVVHSSAGSERLSMDLNGRTSGRRSWAG